MKKNIEIVLETQVIQGRSGPPRVRASPYLVNHSYARFPKPGIDRVFEVQMAFHPNLGHRARSVRQDWPNGKCWGTGGEFWQGPLG